MSNKHEKRKRNIYFVLYGLYPFTCCLYSPELHNMHVKPTHQSKCLLI